MNSLALVGFRRSLARHPVQAAVMVGGLGLGMGVFLVLGLFVRFQLSFERWLPHHERLYLVQNVLSLPGSPFNGAYPGTMAGMWEELQADFPDLHGTRLRGGKDGGSVLVDGAAVREDVAEADPGFPDLFRLPMVAGTRTLDDPGALLISRSAARRFFGDADAIGRTLTVSVDDPRTYRVAGMFEDLPAASDLRFSLLLPMPRTAPPGNWTWYQWGTASLATYLRFDTPAEARRFQALLPAFVDRHGRPFLGPRPSSILALRLLPIAAAHLQPAGPESAGARLRVVAVGLIGSLALAMAGLNYLNLSVVRAGTRTREVAMRKVVGADRRRLLRQYVGEAMTTVGLSAAVALVLAELALPLVNAAGGLSLTMPYGEAVPALGATAAVLGLLAGFYPALLLSRLPMATMLASARTPGGGREGARLREALTLVQFALAIACLIGTAVLVAQARHLRAADLGFRRDGLLVVRSLADPRLGAPRARSLLTAFSALPGVNGIGTADYAAGDDGQAHVDVVERPGQAGPGPSFLVIDVGPGFFEAYAPRLLAGRWFDDRHRTDEAADWNRWDHPHAIVVDRGAAAALGFRSPADAVGQVVGGARPRLVIGVVDTLRFGSPRSGAQPSYYVYHRDIAPSPIATIRYAGDPRPLVARLRATWRAQAPDLPFEAATADAKLTELYKDDDTAARLFAAGTGVAVLIGCAGLWGLASFSTARRVKEIGIRKTLGASAPQVARLLVGQFLRPVLLANLAAWPLAFAGSRWWLAGFNERVALSPWFFIGASLLALAVAVLTVLSQSLRAARAAPAWALRHE